MTKYFQIYDDYFLDYGLTGGPTLPDGSVLAGKMTDGNKLPELVYEINVPDDQSCPHFMTGEAVIVSKQFIDALLSMSVQNFQSFPAVLVNPDTGKKRGNYFLFNVLGLIKAADLSQSSFDMLMEGDPEGVDVPLVAFNHLVLDAKKIRSLKMFRLAEDPTSLIIDETVVNGLKQHRPVGGWGVIFEAVDTL
ncbi:MAG: hypothetical protein EOO52_08590 [Gammaproteobacteria bacterium]|nr:MAG: hypothetical protein EOO52_08590 [Gammaproteobacteria bacterium]